MLTTIAKAGDVLALFSTDCPEWGVREIAAALDSPKSNVHQILTSLAAIGLLHRTTRSRYRLGWRLLSMGEQLVTSPLHRAAADAMRHLARSLNETIHLSIFDGQETVLVGRAPGTRADTGKHRSVGETLPSHASASGKLLLAHHPHAWAHHTTSHRLSPLTWRSLETADELNDQLEAIANGLPATDVEESRAGIACVAAPIWEASEVCSALSIVVPVARFHQHRAGYARAVQTAARRITEKLEELSPAATRPA